MTAGKSQKRGIIQRMIHTINMWVAVRTVRKEARRYEVEKIESDMHVAYKGNPPTGTVKEMQISDFLSRPGQKTKAYRSTVARRLAGGYNGKRLNRKRAKKLREKIQEKQELITDCIGKDFLETEREIDHGLEHEYLSIKRPAGSFFITLPGLLTELFFTDAKALWVAIGSFVVGVLVSHPSEVATFVHCLFSKC